MARDEETVRDADVPNNDPVPAVMPTEFDLVVVNMDQVLYEGKAKSMIAPAPFGNFAILPGHTPLFIQLVKGKLVIDTGSGQKEMEIDGGVAKITQAKTIVLVGFANSGGDKK